ncbi:HNH endonuclease [Kitasatospora sp. NPDC087315]|uniref:HNH endonuclease n=1 Tax=Kitasatospora sp. NPDC087315 TaxID=3364069 RepID=UPI00382E2D57
MRNGRLCCPGKNRRSAGRVTGDVKRQAKRRWRDPTRFFSWGQKQQLIRQANGRCEHTPPLWFRCPAEGTEADHIHPWSRGGPTEMWNGQLLCRRHNRRKSNRVPSPLYSWRLARWRKRY